MEESGLILRRDTQAHGYQSGHWAFKNLMPTPLMKQMGSFYKISLQIPFSSQLINAYKQVDKDNFFFFYFLSKYGNITETFYQKL